MGLVIYNSKKIEEILKKNGWKKQKPVRNELALSGWQDSNLRPPRPKRGAMTGLRYTPFIPLLGGQK